MSILFRFLLAILAIALPVFCAAGETGYAIRDLDVLAEPHTGAKVLWKLHKNAAFDLLRRQTAWAEISSGGHQGWVLFFYLGIGQAPKESLGKEIGGVLGLATSRHRGQVTATIGIRGITEEKLAAAQFNEKELRKLESLAVSAETANSFAEDGGLESRELKYLPDPAASSSGDDTSGND